MFKYLFAFTLLLPQLGISQDQTKLTIKDVKSWVKATDPRTTCADEYLKRRKQLGIAMGVAPLTIAASFAGGGIAGGAIGNAAYWASGVPGDGWAELGYTLGGAFIGVVVGVGVTATMTTISTTNFFNNQRLIKAIYESRNDGDTSLLVLHRKYLKKYPQDSLSIQEFTQEIAHLDQSGKLCDGSLVSPNRYRKGRKLKQRLATKGEIFRHLHEGISTL
jgi:hypothetical protein